MSKTDEQLARWAVKHLGIQWLPDVDENGVNVGQTLRELKPEEVTEVTFHHEDGYEYSEYTYESPYDYALVKTNIPTGYGHVMELKIYFNGDEIGALVREVLEA